MSARLETLLGAVDRLIRAPGVEEAVEGDAQAFLEGGGLSRADAEATARFGAARLLVYRKLVRRGIAAAVRTQMPRAADRLGTKFDALVDAFVEERAPASHYLRDVAFELVDFAAPRLEADPEVAPFLIELARHELSAYAAGSAPDPERVDRPEVALDRAVVFDPSARVARYEHAVHELSEEVGARDVPRRAATRLFVYRDAEDEIRYLALTPFAAAVVERLLAGDALGAAVKAGAADAGVDLDDAALAGAASLLEDLKARGALLGAALPGEKP
jgi:uncharacterized protein